VNLPNKIPPRYSVGLPSSVARQVEQYAEEVDMSMSKAITALVRIGLESQQDRKRQFFERLNENLANNDPKQQDRLVDEFRTLILGR
jgi:glucose-6-phosphate-specific signal transduction histidine kinase